MLWTTSGAQCHQQLATVALGWQHTCCVTKKLKNAQRATSMLSATFVICVKTVERLKLIFGTKATFSIQCAIRGLGSHKIRYFYRNVNLLQTSPVSDILWYNRCCQLSCQPSGTDRRKMLMTLNARFRLQHTTQTGMTITTIHRLSINRSIEWTKEMLQITRSRYGISCEQVVLRC